MKKIIGIILILSSFSLMAESIRFNDSIPVIKSEPIYKLVTKRTPYQECWNEQVPVSSRSNNGNVGALLGGVAGGILGHQVGGGGGKIAATVGGAILGTLVGKNLSNNNGGDTTTYRTQRKCVTKYNESQEESFIGYKNIGNYKGKTIIKYSNYPLNRIRLRIIVNY